MGEPAHAWSAVRTFMRHRCGVVLAEDQRYLLDARLGPVARQLKFPSIGEYVDAACAPNADSRVALPLIDAMTTHETSFFRDHAFWRVLEETVLPALFAASGGPRPLRIWSAACSTGQEPISLAILLDQLFPAIAARTEIIATDISSLTIDRATSGVFSRMEINRGLHTTRLLRYFDQHVDGFCLKPELKRRIRWSPHNLLGAAPGPAGCDLVLCRNVLFYFDDPDRHSVVRRLRDAASAGGFVGIGTTEMISRAVAVGPGWFKAQELPKTISLPEAIHP